MILSFLCGNFKDNIKWLERVIFIENFHCPVKADISYKGVTRVETYPFPKDTIIEVAFNAIVHKFYGALLPIQICVYIDMIYITNDCIFPEDWTIDDLMGRIGQGHMIR